MAEGRGLHRPHGEAVGDTGEALKVLFASAEMFPFAKVGGLADVSGALPKELAALGHEVRVVIPAYAGLGGEPLTGFDLAFGTSTVPVVVRRLALHHGVEVLTVGAPGWFE